MKNLIKNYEDQILTLEKNIEKYTEIIRSVRRKNLSTEEYYKETEDDRLKRSMTSAKIQTLVQVIKDIEGSDTLVILDYLVDLNKEHGADSSGRRILRVEQNVFDKMKDITKSIK